jgi:acyl-CoA synthetase (AMP-forming)/AMP-acid ligase II
VSAAALLTKRDLVTRYDEILDRGCLGSEDRDRLRRGQDVEGVVIQQSGGSSGEVPLRLPRTNAEIQWLATKLLARFHKEHGSFPTRGAFLGGISHTEATQRAEVDAPIAIEDFAGDQLDALDAFDPDVISMYPSFARAIVAHPTLDLTRLRSVKLGGETILPSDLERLRARFGDLVIVEQFGSTEMPGIAFRTLGPDKEAPYDLSTDRYDVDWGGGEGWQPLVVRDRFPQRAFPIDGWYDTEDEVFVERGSVRRVRRRDDPATPWLGDLDGLLRAGFVHVQVLPREKKVLVSGGTASRLTSLSLAGEELVVCREAPYRLIDSNKMPLWLDTDRVDLSRTYRSDDVEATADG